MYNSISIIASRIIDAVSNLMPMSNRQRAAAIVSQVHRMYPSLDFRLELAFARRSSDIVYSRFSELLDHLTSIGINPRDIIINSNAVILQSMNTSIMDHLPDDIFDNPLTHEGWLVLPFKDPEDRTYFQVAVAIHSQRRWPNESIIKSCYSILYESPVNLEESINIVETILEYHPEYDLSVTLEMLRSIHSINQSLDDGYDDQLLMLRDIFKQCKPFKIELNTGVIKAWHHCETMDELNRLGSELTISHSRRDTCNILAIHCDDPLSLFHNCIRAINLITTLIY
uniref:Uncharacterized protein n=1 Tax=viral metagenome TaxID=1070528 RepID=A0A6C0BLF4_9ZZZZ